MKNMNSNAAENKLHKYPLPVKLEEMNRMPGQEERGRRTRSSKVFSLGRGLYQAVMYPEPVHFMNKKTGELQEIDNTLVPVTDNAGSVYLMNRCNDEMKVEFHNAQDAAMILLQNEDGRLLGWKLEDAQEVQPHIVAHAQVQHSDKDLRRNVLDQLDGEVVYENIYPDVNLNCSVQSLHFKDYFTFNTAESIRPLSFLLSMPDMIPEKQPDGSIQIIAPTGEIAFTLPCPFMQDAAIEANFGSVDVNVTPTEEAFTWRVTYVPDMEWMQSAQFPIILDPAVITKDHSTAIEDNFVTSKKTTTVQLYNATNMIVSYNHSTWGTSRSYIKFLPSDLPTIDSSYYITKATFSVKTKTAPTAKASIYLKEVLGDWSSRTITYANAPALADKPLDYQYMETNNTWYNYDISNLVRKWYDGQNYGFALEANTSTYINLFTSDHVYYKPYVTINYVSLAGLEDYLVYEDQNVGRAGVGHVNLYNGNLIFERQDTSCEGNRMPVSVGHFYNSCYRNVTDFGVGAGWKMNIQQTLHKETLTDSSGSTTFYVYMDADGTRHHFKKTSGEWKDQSGLDMTLTISGSTVTISDKGHNTMTFDLPTEEFADNYANVMMLKTMSDACGNTMTVNANGRMISSVQDGIGRNTVFANSNNRVSTIYPPGYEESGACGFDYDANGRMTHVWELSGQTGTESMSYTYDENGLLTSATNCDGLKVTYEYYTVCEPYRVKRVRITGGNLCAYDRTYEYKDCLTVVTDNLSGKKLFYHFNDYGNCVSVNDQLGYACFAKYSDSNPVNHPETISKMQRAVVNFLAGHNMEAAGSWTNANLSGSGSYSYAADAYYMGSQSLKMAKTSASGLMTSFQTVTLPKGKTYTFSAFFKTLSNALAQLRVTYKDNTGADVSVDSMTQSNTAAWDRLSVNFTLPADSTSDAVTVRLMAAGGTGTVWFDCAQLEEGPVANSYNMLINGDFTLNADAHPTGWSKNSSNTSKDIVYTSCTGTKPEGLSTNTMRMYGTGRTKYAGIYQDLPISGSKGDVFVAGGWSMNFSKPRKGENFRYNIRVAFLKSGTTTRVNSDSIEWSEEWTDWQFAAGPVVAPCDYTSIRYNVDYERNINYAEFNGLFLHKEEFGETYVYDSKGNILSSKDAASLQDGATYDSFDNILTYYQPGRSSSVKTTMEWGSTDAEKKKHLLRKSTSPLGTISEYTYDANGNCLTTKTSDGTSFMQTSTAYDADGNHVTAQTDARGKTVSRVVNTSKDTLTSITDPRGQTVSYTYDQNRKVTKTAATVNGKEYANKYTYTKDRLTQVKHNTSADASGDVAYNFEYDTLGRPTVVKVDNQVLSSTTYNANGTVQRVDYGNEDSVEYSYDEFKRTKGIRYAEDSEDRYTYEYGANGQIAQLTNKNLRTVTTSEYDAAGRPARITRKHLDTGEHLYTGEVSYDKFNNLNTFSEQVGSERTTFGTTFTHDNENRPTLLNFGNSRQVAYVYDGLGRISRRTVNAGGTDVATTYGYLAGGHGTGSTTPLVETITQSGTTLTYTYDDTGNITSVSDGTKTISYEYDLLGQLTRVNDPYDSTAGSTGTTWKYAYDQGGNIQSKTAYAFTTGTVGSAVKTDFFTYGDANWKDKLTAFNGQTITYDAIGNPLNDGTWNYTWNGRQMRATHKGNFGEPGYDEITYDYNEDGLRTKKTRMYYDDATGDIGYKATSYTLHGKNIVHMTENGNELHFFYDVQNKPAVVVFNGTAYAYLYNLQGDVIGLLDSNGTKMVSYSYDAWGKMLSKTGTLASTLGTIQPFRYRGYVYDEETGLYYLRSRYYAVNVCRFMNADILLGKQLPLQHNLYTYCNNSPVARVDVSGCANISSLLTTFIIRIKNTITIIRHTWKMKISPNPRKPTITVSALMRNLQYLVDKKKDMSSPGDTGCAMFIRAGILGKKERHSHHFYSAGMSSMFDENMIFHGEISDIGGIPGLIPGMILGEAQDNPDRPVKHGGVYYGLYDFGNGPEPAVYSFDTVKKRGHLHPFSDNKWVYYGWHEGVIFD